MPSSSAKQSRFMKAVAASPEFAAEAGVPQSVGKEFVQADEAAGKFTGRSGSDRAGRRYGASRKKREGK
jgi:hypothetical protein